MLRINKQENYVPLYYRRLVDGIIVIGNRTDDPHKIELEENKVPSVVVPGFPVDSHRNIASVNSDSFKCVQRAVSYLVKRGHRKIAFILGQMDSMFSVDRFQTYQAVFRENALSYDPKYIVESDFSKRDGFRLMGELAESNAQLVARSVRIARELGKEPATPDEARGFLGLTGTAS